MKTVNDWKPTKQFNYFRKSSILDVWQNSEYASTVLSEYLLIVKKNYDGRSRRVKWLKQI